MKTYTAILVDDEHNALQNLKNKIEKNCHQVQVVQIFDEPKKALEYIRNDVPDILFLDIQMPVLNGFELLQQITDLSSQIIFSTAYNQYAIDAIKQDVVDYILKPVDDQELKTAIEKAITNIEKGNTDQNQKLVALLQKVIKNDHKLKIPTQKGISFIPQQEIIHLEGYDGYTKIHLIDGSILTSSYSLGKFTPQLEPYFFKCHKSHVINVKAVRSFENEGYLVMGKDYRVPITKTYKKAFLGLFD